MRDEVSSASWRPVRSPLSPVRIVIADDQPIARNGLRWLLQSDPSLLVVGETANSAGTLALLQDREADVLLLRFPADAAPALDILRRLTAEGSAVRTVILAESIDSSHVVTALELGACGVILKDSPAEVLFNSIRSVMAGGFWIDGKAAADAAAGLRLLETRRRRPKAFGLTRRELDIVKAVVAGSTNKEMAQTFSISENTVKRHLSHIFNKLGASNRVELALFASHHRLLEE